MHILENAMGLTKLNNLERGHAAVGVLGRETVGLLNADRHIMSATTSRKLPQRLV
jgi:hypothetical protein